MSNAFTLGAVTLPVGGGQETTLGLLSDFVTDLAALEYLILVVLCHSCGVLAGCQKIN